MQTVDATCEICGKPIRWFAVTKRRCEKHRGGLTAVEQAEQVLADALMKPAECWYCGRHERGEDGECLGCGRFVDEVLEEDEDMADKPKTPRPASAPTSDFAVVDHGSIVIVSPRTAAARAWIRENVREVDGYHPNYPELVVEPRYVAYLLAGIEKEGLTWL